MLRFLFKSLLILLPVLINLELYEAHITRVYLPCAQAFIKTLFYSLTRAKESALKGELVSLIKIMNFVDHFRLK